jgi:hypothetical protein
LSASKAKFWKKIGFDCLKNTSDTYVIGTDIITIIEFDFAEVAAVVVVTSDAHGIVDVAFVEMSLSSLLKQIQVLLLVLHHSPC